MIPSYSFTGDSRSLEPQAIQRMAADAYEATQRIYYWLTEWREMRLDFDDGSSVIVLGKQATQPRAQTNHEWFGVTDISEGDTFRVRVNDGRFNAPDVSGINSDPPVIAAVSKEISVTGGDFTVSNGFKVLLKLTAGTTDASHTYTNEAYDESAEAPAESGTVPITELLTVAVTTKAKTWAFTSGQILVQAAQPANTATVSYRLLADIEITDGTMTIKPRIRGSVDTSAITGVYGDHVGVDAATADHTVCIDGVAEEVTFIAKNVE